MFRVRLGVKFRVRVILNLKIANYKEYIVDDRWK